MSFYPTATYKSVLTQQALGTMGANSDWDARITAFLSTLHLMHADEAFGAKSKTDEAASWVAIKLEGKFGKGWKQHPDASAEVALLDVSEKAADEAHHQSFIAPYWAAMRGIALTPAPTLAAACFKQSIIQSDEVWNDSAMDADCMQIVADDFARLLPDRPERQR